MTQESTDWLRHLYQEDLYLTVNQKEQPLASQPEKRKYIIRKGVLVLFESDKGSELPEGLKAFLLKILNAVGLNENDARILPLSQVPNTDDGWFETVICFGQWPDLPDQPVSNSYTIQKLGGTQYLQADVLENIEKDVTLKKQLWDNLKVMFKA